jgi:hypothetical protein
MNGGGSYGKQMNAKICLGANTHQLIKAGGHLWFYLNWALGLKALGCRVVWLEQVDLETPIEQLGNAIKELKEALAPFGLQDSVALCSSCGGELPFEIVQCCINVEEAVDADLFLNVGGKIGPRTAARFRRTAFVDIDPGLTQIWIHEGKQPIAPHDLYFSIGETVGTSRATFPDCGVPWIYTPHPICLSEWKPAYAAKTAPYTSVTSWWGWWEEFQGETFNNEKRTPFLDYLDLPQRTPARLELALALWGHNDHEDVHLLQDHGWEVKAAFDITGTPEDYRQYLRTSRGEFSCAKPSCMLLENAWISDRSLCYMAMGKPAVVQYCGSSPMLSEAEGLFRFRNMEEAARAIETAEADYDYYGRQARAFVEEYFEATKVVGALLERALA